MKISDLIPAFSAHKSKTEAALEAHTLALAERDKTISDLSAKLTALEAASKIKADDDAAPADTEDSSEVDELIAALQKVLDSYKSGEDSDSTDADDSSDESDSSDDSTDDANDESTETAKASKVEKLKALTKAASKIVAEQKALKASVPKQVIREIAAVGIPTPIATKPDGKTTALKGLDRVAAAISEQFTPKK